MMNHQVTMMIKRKKRQKKAKKRQFLGNFSGQTVLKSVDYIWNGKQDTDYRR